MEKGKFSQPRPYRDEERQIEEAFRQVTSQGAKKQTYQPKFAQEESVPTETMVLPVDELPEEAFPSQEEVILSEAPPVSEPEDDSEELFSIPLEDEPLPPVQDAAPQKSKREALKDFLFAVEEP